MQDLKLHFLGKACRYAVGIYLIGIISFGLQKNLVALFIAEAHDLIFY